MISKSDKVFREALDLSPIERASLADQLLFSLDKPDEQIDDIWRKEIAARLAAFKSAQATTVSAEEVLESYYH